MISPAVSNGRHRARQSWLLDLLILSFSIGVLARQQSPRDDATIRRVGFNALGLQQGPLIEHPSRHDALDDMITQQPELAVHDDVLDETLNKDKGWFLPVATKSALIDALDVMQSHFFEIWEGTWPRSIDWTGAVLGTYVAATLSSMSSFQDTSASILSEDDAIGQENMINRYFSQLTAYYFGQDAFSLRNEAYDDMLWVVLGWLEAVKFINQHSTTHYERSSSARHKRQDSRAWYGKQFISAVSHRARVFYDIAAKGWDTSLCDGGMIWNPYLRPYKNAITNELFIAASVSMYLYFPGDENPSPFEQSASSAGLKPARPHDTKHLSAALDAYAWLTTSNMTNAGGLYVDGYHISGNWTRSNTMCDERNEMTFTYNQGVILTGLRGLWESTGSRGFLQDGHELIESVIQATGWNLSQQGIASKWNHSADWAGMGRHGVLEEYCDAAGRCSQDGQNFKGIFFHHLTTFCVPLPTDPWIPGKTFAADPETMHLHETSCLSYGPWIAHNAYAAYQTRNRDGEFGMWWGRHNWSDAEQMHVPLPPGAEDYRGSEIPPDMLPTHGAKMLPREALEQRDHTGDVNDRGRGRTVETQGGGIAVIRALWEVVEKRKFGM